MMGYALIAAKLAVGLLCLVILINRSGRSQLAPRSAADQVGNYVLGGIIGGMIYNEAVSILEMVFAIITWRVLRLILWWITSRNLKAERLIEGSSLLVFDAGELSIKNLHRAKKSVRSFIADMHVRGIHRLEELQSVWLETNGNYSIQKKGEAPFALSVIEDGQPVMEGLKKLGQNEAWLMQQLAAQGIEAIDGIAYAEWYLSVGNNAPTLHVYPCKTA